MVPFSIIFVGEFCVTIYNISFRLSFRCDANFKIPTNSVKTNYKYRIIPYYKTGMQK